MRLLVNRRLHINMGNYEHIETLATVEVNTETDTEILAKHGVDITDLAAVEIFLNEETNNLLSADVEDAHFMTTEDESFVHEYKEHHTKEKK